jgi:hypothetical protein
VFLLVLAISMIGFANAQNAGNRQQGHHVGSAATTSTCSFTFQTGANNNFMKFCVTANGNIPQFESPQGHEHINVFDISEGYGICDLTTDGSSVSYFDYSDQGDSGNWGSPSVLSQNTNSVKIARTTLDGNWTLTQTFTRMSGASPFAQVAMALANNTAVDRVALLIRSADVDADGLVNNNLDSTLDSAFGWNSVTSEHGYGLALQNVGNSAASLQFGIVTPTPNSPDPCNVQIQAAPEANTDGVILMAYALLIPKSSSQTVKVAYRGF